MKYKFLCVDDERYALAALKQVCRAQNPANEIFAFDNAADALDFCRECTPDVALLDIDMPEMSGLQLAERLAALHPRLNIILVTAYSEYALDAYSLHCSGYLLKPITLQALNEQLQVLRFPPAATKAAHNIEIRCFGDFEVFCGGKPVRFSHKKTKELLAYLVDRRGAVCTNPQIAAALWEDDTHGEYLKKLKRDLVDTFSALTPETVFAINRGLIGLNAEAVSCDLFDFLDGKIGLPGDEYMEQYSWAEQTKSMLLNRLL